MENILSADQQAVMGLKHQKAISESDYLKRSWISPLLIQGGYQQNESRLEHAQSDRTSGTAGVRIDQDIFRSGGILAAHRYATALGRAGSGSVGLELHALVGEAYMLLFALRRTQVQIAKQNYLLQNARIDIWRKQEQYDQGLIDSSVLHSALLERNAQAAGLLELEESLRQLHLAFGQLSDHHPDRVELPVLEPLEQERFLTANLPLAVARDQLQASGHYARMIASKYLPRLSVGASYQHYWHDESDPLSQSGAQESLSSWGLTLTIPLDIKGHHEYQSVRLESKIAARQLDLQSQQQLLDYRQSRLRQAHLQRQMELAQEDIDLYASLLARTADRVRAGSQTEDDRAVMANAKAARELDLKIYELNSQEEWLKLYLRMVDATL